MLSLGFFAALEETQAFPGLLAFPPDRSGGM